MAIAEDGSTPAVVTASANSTGVITTASFSPPANSLLVVMVNVGFASAGSGIASVTISDSVSGTYTAGPFLGDSAADNSGIWFRFLSSAPGSITVTATNSNHPAAGYQLAVRVLTGAASSQGAGAGAGSATHTGTPATTAVTSAITTTVTGSAVYVAACGNAGDTFTAAAATTLISNFTDGTDAEVLGAGRATSLTGSPGSTTLGFTSSGTVKFSWVALEILPSTGTTANAGLATGTGAALAPVFPGGTVVNQWAGSYGQGTTFTSITSALQSCVVPLTVAASVGGGSGTPTAGNWLFCIASWTQAPAIAEVHVGTGDDIHSYWRQYPASSASGNVRTAIAYTANTASAAGRVYVAPDGQVAAMNVLVVEVSGLGPWDTVVGTNTNYAAAATSLSLALGAPSGPAFWIAGVGGDSTAPTQTFAPSGYTTLHSLSQTNGSDHLADNHLTSAYRVSSSASQSISASTSGGSEDLSGFLIGVLAAGPSPIPAAQNPNWPLVKFEAGFGSGFNTPASEVTWTDLTGRLWNWDETTGVQFQLAEIQATQLLAQIDNFDGALTPSASPWSFTASGTPAALNYFIVTTAQAANITMGDGFTDTTNPGTLFTVTNVGGPSGGFNNITFTPPAGTAMNNPDVVSQIPLPAGTPVRLRMAVGTMGGVTTNRWYVVQRNAMDWTEQIDEQHRRYIDMTGSDLWAALNAAPPTPYRTEIYEDGPYAWWPCDDQPGNAGVLPTSLLNAALGNTNTLNVLLDPGGGTAQGIYDTAGVNLTSSASTLVPPTIATYTTGASSGWMFGDPVGSPSSFATGNPVSAQPGSAAWQQTGAAGNTGSNGWYLICNDASFPPLSGGVTVEGWFNYQYFASNIARQPSGQPSVASQCQQPYTNQTLLELATSSNPVAELQLDRDTGNLNLITYAGATPTSHSIYSSSDLRTTGWFMVTMTLTTTAWHVLVNGSATADVSGSAAGMTSAWTYLIVNGDFGSGGGSTPSGLVHGGNVQVSHLAVYPYILPYYRMWDHWWAAVTSFGQIPAPTAVAPQLVGPIANIGGAAYPPDGSIHTGSYTGSSGTVLSVSALATANAGGFTSGPSARGTAAAVFSSTSFNYLLWVGFTGVSSGFQVYTGTSAGGELEASAVTVGGGDSYSSGFGSGASSHGVASTASGTGASPPATPSSIGDTVGQRIERLMHGGSVTSPNRCIDPASLLVQAPGSTGLGSQTGQAIQALQESDSGLLFVDGCGNLTYWERPHLAAQYSSPLWSLGPTTSVPGRIPYYKEVQWITDPQRIFNVITISPLSPTGAALPLITPADAATANNSQAQNGAQPLQITSYLQSTAEQQAQANWILANFSSPGRRADNVMVDAAPYPAAWPMVCGASVGDVATAEDWQVGGGGGVFTYRITQLKRRIDFGSHDQPVTGHLVLTLDIEPTSYWT